MIFYIENLKESTKRLLELFSDFNMVEGLMSVTWKSIIFLYTKTHMKTHIFKTTIYSFLKIKFLCINIIKHLKVV